MQASCELSAVSLDPALHGLTGELAHGVELREVGLDVEPRILDAGDEQRRGRKAGPGRVGGRGQRRRQVLMHRWTLAGSASRNPAYCVVVSGFSRTVRSASRRASRWSESFNPSDDQLRARQAPRPDSCS